MSVNLGVIALANRCDCEKCRRHLEELEKADLEDMSETLDKFFTRYTCDCGRCLYCLDMTEKDFM